jgi:hypothetical protein
MGKRNKLAKSGLSRKYKKNIINKERLKENDSVISEISENVVINNEPKPIRHRRKITNIVLSRGQKRRLKKKAKFIPKKKLEDNLKTKNKEEVSHIHETKTDKFNLGDIDNTLLNMLNDISTEKKEVKLDSIRKNKKNRQM